MVNVIEVCPDRLRFVQEVGRYDADLTSVLFAPLRELCVALHEVSGVWRNWYCTKWLLAA